MSSFEKTGNVLCIILAWLLSFVLVIMLMVTPMMLSALSLLKSDTIAQVVIDTFTELVEQEFRGEQDVAADYQLTKLAAVSQEVPQDVRQSDSQNPGGVAGILEGYLGASVDREIVENVLSSNAIKEIIHAYSDDLTRVLTGEEKMAELDAQKIKDIVNDNMDEIVEIVRQIHPEMTENDTIELKKAITQAVEEKAEEVVQLLPKPEEIRQQLIEESPELEIALNVIAQKNTIKWVAIGATTLLCVLIFVCRLWGFRGFRWLAVDLFVGGGINVLFCAALLIETPVILNMIPDSALNVVVGNLLHTFDNGMLVRTAVILLCGGLSLTAYILIKKMRAQKAAVNVEE